MSSEILSNYIARLPAGPEAGRPLYRNGNERVSGQFYACHLNSVFQPVIRADGSLLGHAALVRCGNGEELSPWKLFSEAADDGELISLDRLARTVHAINYFLHAPDDRTLFLSVDARLIESVAAEHGRTFERVLTGFGVPTRRVVIVLPESLNTRPALLAPVLASYRLRGYRVAVRLRESHDTDRAVLQNFASFRPDIVLIRVTTAESLRRQVEAVRAFGGIALVTHVESGLDLAAVRAAGADCHQGFAFGKPAFIGAREQAISALRAFVDLVRRDGSAAVT